MIIKNWILIKEIVYQNKLSHIVIEFVYIF